MTISEEIMRKMMRTTILYTNFLLTVLVKTTPIKDNFSEFPSFCKAGTL